MENFNTGKVVDEIKPGDYEKAALDFSEGSESLRKLLLDCFNKGIQTAACCAGHEKEHGKQNPYIVFKFNEKNMDAILRVIAKMSEKEGVNIVFSKEPGTVSNFAVEFPKEISEECFEMVRQACLSPEKIQAKDLEKSMQTVLDIMKNHVIEKSYLQIDYTNVDGNKSYGLGVRPDHYPGVVSLDEEYSRGIDGIVYVDDADRKGCLEEAQKQVRNARYMKEVKRDEEAIDEIIENEEFKKAFDINWAATREQRMPNDNALYLEVGLGQSLEEVAKRVMELHRAGQPVITKFNSFTIDTRQYDSEQAIIQAYDKLIEEHQKAKEVLGSGVKATETVTGMDEIKEEEETIERLNKEIDVIESEEIEGI